MHCQHAQQTMVELENETVGCGDGSADLKARTINPPVHQRQSRFRIVTRGTPDRRRSSRVVRFFFPSPVTTRNSQSFAPGLKPFACLIITAKRSGCVSDALESFSRTIIESVGKFAALLPNIAARPRPLT